MLSRSSWPIGRSRLASLQNPRGARESADLATRPQMAKSALATIWLSGRGRLQPLRVVEQTRAGEAEQPWARSFNTRMSCS